MKRTYIWIFATICVLLITWKLYVNKQESDAQAALAQVTRSFVPVEVVSVHSETLSNQLEANGIFMPVKEMFVISETQGRVIQVFKDKGEWVNESDLIAKVDDELLQTELEATQANIAKLKKDRDRLGNLIEGEAVAKNKIEDIELGLLAAEAKEKALKKQIANTNIKAPMSGTLGLRFIERGSVIGPGIQVAQITNLEKLFLIVNVTEHDVLHLKKGQSVSVVADVYPNRSIPGKVTNVGLRADKAFNYMVEIEIHNPKDAPLRAGMHAQARFTFDTDRQGLTVPRKAIAGSLQDAKVYIVKGDTAHLRAVTLGSIYGDKVEVVSGLKQGEQVVVAGQFNISDGTVVEVVK
ncbi:MAG: efflux RND transporter periplasmic adaptor subunit [Bacteroidetes bacterium]|nr:MAG: efflux RND transporter periplasmic adaptor subunit [Bacteroidota bacterium]